MIDRDAITYLSDIPAAQAAVRGAAPALVHGQQTQTYAELQARTAAAAAMLHRLGLKPGERVAWLGRNCLEWYELFFGCAAAGLCFAPINTRLAAQEIGYIVGDSEAPVLFVTPDFLATAKQALAGLARLPRLIVAGAACEGHEDLSSLLASGGAGFTVDPVDPDADVLQLYTSGTTGLPKGVQLTQRNYAAFLEHSAGLDGFSFDAGETVLMLMPLFHVAGTNMSFAGLAHGARVIVLSEFVPADVLRLIATERVAHMFVVPSMIGMLLRAPEIEGADLSSLRTISYGASPIGEAVLAAAKARFGCDFVQFYGMTESAGAGTCLAAADHQPDKLRSCGKAWPGFEVRIADAEGRDLPAGEVGEIQIRGGTIMKGYWKRADATRATLAGGWLHTGDAGYRDAAGYFFVHDRLKDMIVSGGENIYPAEVENAIFGCPGVADVAVIGVPSEVWGEEVKAIVVPAAGQTPTADAIIAWAKSRIAGYKAPKSVAFVDALPRNPSGKVLRRELRRPYWEGHERAVG